MRTKLGLSLKGPGVAGVKAQLFGNLESADQAGCQPRRSLALGNLQRGLHGNLFPAVKAVDQQERHEGQENQ